MITSSPGLIPIALSARIRASVPFATPTTSHVPRNRPKASSNSLTDGPRMKDASRKIGANRSSTSLRIASYCPGRSRNGTFIGILSNR